MDMIKKSVKLDNVCYDIRGPVLDEAKRLEEEGYNIIKLNTGNPAPFGLDAPDEIIHDVILNLKNAQGYCDSKGIFPARKSIMQYYQKKGIMDLEIEDIYIGNGVSELIVMAMQGLLNNGNEILIPAPDYPLWTAAVNLSGGTAVHYLCDEQANWYPDIEDIKSKINDRTRGIVIINPNNPTGAVYPREVLESIVELAHQHDLILFADEIYEKICYDGLQHTSLATLTGDLLCVTMSGLSKSHRVAGFRAGWMVLTGDKTRAKGYIEGLNMLASMRLCSNVTSQYAIQTSLGGYQSISDLVAEGGRLKEQRDLTYQKLIEIPGISCVKPRAGFYLFPKVDQEKFNVKDDEKLALDLLLQEKILLVQGTAFNWPDPDHFRIVFLPRKEELGAIMEKLSNFLTSYHQ
ncbi:aminotransferase class I/II-fold pyridoxal phosphate-dependent enzyme [Iocasia frigidifontis]|uniref:Alanine aminotransferase n=1 Tax=Iocasia fonsfrigidae TaxID=2682810 RepID=A0A8A7KH79_9FIRM|nr:pyridoxal phosphate-dependent aminotransferase [Iocasia fonsfrigidae]QTL97232.1 aminotransferase class I/II-fold pyridoxal phosphate-dependent enzyme [Iocasia fonsfrigidae]